MKNPGEDEARGIEDDVLDENFIEILGKMF